MSKYRIAYIPGDGIGPEIMNEGLEVLRSIEKILDLSFDFVKCEAGAQAFKKTGFAIQPSDWEVMEKADCIYKAPVGIPGVLRPDGVEVAADVVLGLRSKFDLYVNLRPITLFEGIPSPLTGKKTGSIEYIIVRENTEDLYVMQGGIMRDEVATNLRIITRTGSTRIIRYAFELSREWGNSPYDGKKRVTCVESSKVLVSDKLFAKIFDEISAEYPEIDSTHEYVDAFAQSQVLRPEFYHIVVTPNFHGDIISDLAGATTGGIGLAAGGNIGDEKAMFEPIHGSAPTLGGTGKTHQDKSALKASEMIENAVRTVLKDHSIRTPDLGGKSTTSDMGEAIVKTLEKKV
jgi:3-isopropylmalate dehydrogenase